MVKGLTPLRAARKYCIWCCNGQANEVRLCPSVGCALWSYRFGRNPQQKAETTVLKAIRARCLDCSGNARDVRECWDTDCQLHEYRMGRNPHRAGIGGGIAAL